jgi:riboflavin synthase
MFTGLVETQGTLIAARGTSPRRLTVRSTIPSTEVAIGESVAIDGCCLTVVEATASGLTFEAATETLERTTLGELKVGDVVNLERALCASDRLGGHIVLGHVDAVGEVCTMVPRGSGWYVDIALPAELAHLVASQGSIAVSGVSLTVAAVHGRVFTVMLIPHTRGVTTLGALSAGSRVNLEVDVMARYVERILATKETVVGEHKAPRPARRSVRSRRRGAAKPKR